MMKKLFFLLCASVTVSTAALAAPGDTTWVQANIKDLDNFGSYDSTVTFPTPSAGITYRNIYMIFTLGKHTCAGAVCGDWDYTVQNFLMTPTGDTMELGRFITPYANASGPRTPFTWKQRYIYDVTDYAAKLQGSATMRIFYSGYSGGFTGDIKFAFVEGTPDRTVTGIETLWKGSFNYGGTPDINANFPVLSKTAPAGTASADVKFTVTGHGSDALGCCEFAPHNYQVMLNGASVATKSIWRDNCGLNQIYPQTGTWIYDRGNWCPGAIVYSNMHTLPAITAGSSYNVALQFDPYTGGGSYTTEATLINYSSLNKTVDAGIEQIISPTNDENHFRENPICGKPTIRIKNRGAAPITGIVFQYGIKDSTMSSYTWSGTLAPLEEIDVLLPEVPELNSIAGVSGDFTFVAKIVSVNGAADVDPTDDILTSQFISGPLWATPFKILFKTNNEGTGTSETDWKIYDINNTVVASRTGAALSTLYTDTVKLFTGCYKLVITDGGCNGLQWWANDASVTDGYLTARTLGNVAMPMHGYQYSGQFNNDFGCGFTQYFYVNHPFPAGVDNISGDPLGMSVFPNPAQGVVNVDLSGISRINGTIRIIDALGRVVVSTACRSISQQISLQGLSNGAYTIQFVNDAGNKLQQPLMIVK